MIKIIINNKTVYIAELSDGWGFTSRHGDYIGGYKTFTDAKDAAYSWHL